MQDNGTTQMANFSTTCLEKAISKQLITHKLWAPVSPDLNLLLLFLMDNEKQSLWEQSPFFARKKQYSKRCS
jgi:hypothetical protein